MARTLLAALVGIALVSGCDGTNPFMTDTGGTPNTPDQTPTGTVGGVVLPPGTTGSGNISHYEARDGKGGGYAETVVYNSGNDTFQVDNLAFDGLNTYQRSGQPTSKTPLATLGGYNVYEADVDVSDFLTGSPINQITPYRAIYGESTNTVTVNGNPAPRTRFAIVRTGGYTNYGFGGFLYERNGTVTLPADSFSGQAGFTGRYAGMRVFNGTGGLEFTEGNMEVSIDFQDFNANDAVNGRLYNRVAYDPAGNPVIVGNNADAGELPLPDLNFVIQEGVANFNSNGEIAGNVTSTWNDPNNGPTDYESGVYYGIISGDLTAGDGGEIVGVMVFESTDPRFATTITVQETGGFIVYR